MSDIAPRPPAAAAPGHFLLDGRPLPFLPGQTVLQAARAAGRYIPHLCDHPDFPPLGSCKACSVRIKGRVAASCTWPASEGLEVECESADLQDLRRGVVQMLFAEGQHHCPYCEKSGDCHLQAVAYHLGMQDNPFVHAGPRHSLDASHPEVLLDRGRCILCELCVRASREVDCKSVFAIGGRGLHTELLVDSASGLLKDSRIAATDRAVSVCPVGALMPKRRGFVIPIGQRPFDRADISDDPHET